MSETPHTLINPDDLGHPSGFSHAVLAAGGSTLYLAGQVGADAAGAIVAGGLVAQLDAALRRVDTALAAAGAEPTHVVSMTIYTTAIAEYRAERGQVGAVYRAHFGRHFPAMALVGVTELVDPAAVIEVSLVAVLPPHASGRG